MKINVLVALLFISCFAVPSRGRTGYRIHLKMPGAKDQTVFLTNYYGQALPHIYKSDSAHLNKNGEAEFVSADSAFTGGIYMMLLSDRKTYFEFLLNNGDEMSINAPVAHLPDGIKFKNSPENDRFQEYTSFLNDFSAGQTALLIEFKAARSKSDSDLVRKKAGATSKDLVNYRREYVQKYPNTLLASIFNALQNPEVPGGPHYLEDGVTKDSMFYYRYFKAHFWDGFDFQDDRLIHSPIYDSRLKEYLTKMVAPYPDSLEHESDMLLGKTRGTKDLFKYTLFFLTRYIEDSKIMGMDEVFVYLVENYYMKGDAYWLNNDELTKYIEKARKIAPNVIGNLAPQIVLPNVATGKSEDLLALKARYTMLVFYSPNCGHCQHELPYLDTLYQTGLKNRGVKMFLVATEGDAKAINDFVGKFNSGDWISTWDHEHIGDWRGKYDVYSTPTIYLLDEKKIIRGKRLDHSNIAGLIDYLEKKPKK